MEIAQTRDVLFKSRTDRMRLWFIGDIHDGARGSDTEMVQRVVKAIAGDPLARWVSVGDLVDAVTILDEKRFEGRCLADWITKDHLTNLPLNQADHVIDLLSPIAPKCLGLVSGNHEETQVRKHNVDLTAYIAGRLRAPYLLYEGMIPLRIKRAKDHSFRVRVVILHGHTMSRTLGAKANALERATDIFEGVDVVGMGHCHTKLSIPVERISFDNLDRRVVASKTLGIMTGSFLKGYMEGSPSYVEKAALRPASLGPMAVDISLECESNGAHERIRCTPVEPSY